MTRPKPGDSVVCRVKDSAIVSAYLSYDEEITFQIIARDINGYYIYVPGYYNIKGMKTITAATAEALEMRNKYVGEKAMFIDSNQIVKTLILDGYSCHLCNEFYAMSEPNQSDGTMICWNCRHYRHYA